MQFEDGSPLKPYTCYINNRWQIACICINIASINRRACMYIPVHFLPSSLPSCQTRLSLPTLRPSTLSISHAPCMVRSCISRDSMQPHALRTVNYRGKCFGPKDNAVLLAFYWRCKLYLASQQPYRHQ